MTKACEELVRPFGDKLERYSGYSVHSQLFAPVTIFCDTPRRCSAIFRIAMIGRSPSSSSNGPSLPLAVLPSPFDAQS
jgi:hypothetical protein